VKFFELTIGHVLSQSKTFFSALKAISAFGNLIVVTFTAARVKQEIAKEGVLPYSLFFAKSYDFSLGRLFKHKSQKAETQSDNETFYSEKTPVATLALHLLLTTIMVVGPVLALQPQPYSSSPASIFYAATYVYLINLVLFAVISGGVLVLRFSPKIRWADKTALKRPILSISAASTVCIGAIFAIIFVWVPDASAPYFVKSSGLLPWYGPATFAFCLLGLAVLYWAGLRCYIAIRSAREGKVLHVRREPKFKVEPDGHLTQILEIVTLQWVREVGMRLEDIIQTEPKPLPQQWVQDALPGGYRLNTGLSPIPQELHGHSSATELGLNQASSWSRSEVNYQELE
jgi:amino acid transporter